MPDWQRIVGERLGRMKLPPEERGEVVEELAAHLEDCYGELCEAGSPDPEGYTLAQVPDWKALGRKIQRSKEGPMNKTVRIFVCGCLTGGVAAVLFVSGLVLIAGDFLPGLEAARGPASAPSLPGWSGPVMWLAGGIWTLWLYTLMRPSYRPGTKTAAMAGFAAWVIGVLAAAYWSSVGHLPLNVLLFAAVLCLPAWIAATMGGAWFYEASETRPSRLAETPPTQIASA